MQPDLPWNVAGIPPEAREAARAAARREGLSVGEWLTRRILRSMTEAGVSTASYENERPYRYYGPAAVAPEPATRDSDDMLARVSRSESESQNAYNRIEEQLKSVARRLDQAERSQSDNNRAMNKAATEMNIAAREQAQAFDQLGSHVVSLNDRLSRIERDGTGDSLKEAVKALHHGLSRLADQMSQTANQSASQIAALASNVEQVAGKLIEARSEVDQVSQALQERMASVEMRMRNTERDSYSHSSAVEKALSTIETSQDARKAIEAELQHQASSLSQLNETLNQLSARFAAGDAQHSGAMARLEESVAKLGIRDADIGNERRMQGIEHALTDIVARLEVTERNNLGAAGTVEEGMRNLAMRVDAADKRHRDAVAELRAAVKDATERLATVDPQAAAAGVAAPVAQPVAPPPPPTPAPAPVFDAPPFPDQHAQTFQPVPPPFVQTPPMPEPPPFAGDLRFGGQPVGADSFAESVAQQTGAAGAESFLSAARRSARAAAAAGSEQATGGFSGFSWGASQSAEPAQKSGLTRYALMATLAMLIIAAVVAGALLSHNLTSPAPVAPKAPTVATAPAIAPRVTQPAETADIEQQAPAPQTAAKPPARNTTAPGSPVITPKHTAKTAPVVVQSAPPVGVAAPASAKASQATQSASASPMDRLTSLADSGNAKAELLLGLKFLDGDGIAVNEAEAAKWLERSAKQNEAVAAYRLGTLYERGHGVPADPAKAVQWYTLAAKEGNRKAMHNLAVAYADGTGVQKDLVVAAQWFTRAANLGLADSQFNLAVLYERGMGVQQSLIDAYKWYAVAARQGDAESKTRIDALSTQLSAEDKTAAQKAADSFHPDPLDRNANIPPDISMVAGG